MRIVELNGYFMFSTIAVRHDELRADGRAIPCINVLSFRITDQLATSGFALKDHTRPTSRRWGIER